MQNVRSLHKELELKNLIMHSFVPESAVEHYL